MQGGAVCGINLAFTVGFLLLDTKVILCSGDLFFFSYSIYFWGFKVTQTLYTEDKC